MKPIDRLMSSTEKIETSVIVPAYHSESTILPCLDSVMKQRDPASTEVIVVNSSDDAAQALVARHFPDVIFFQSGVRLSAGAARNKGVEVARGKVLVFIDSDCIAETDWLQKMIAAHSVDKCGAAGGGVYCGNGKQLIAWAGYFLEFSEFLPGGPVRHVSHIPTCNISYKRSVFERLGGFDVDLYPAEDKEFNHRILISGDKILFDPSIRVRHFHRTGLSDFLEHQHRIGRMGVRLRRKLGKEPPRITRHPLFLCIASPALLLARLVFFLKRLLTLKPSFFPIWLLSSPFYLLGLLWWMRGFAEESRPGRAGRSGCR
ncbi:MAG: glycosyltransferase [Planctomycetota bacterium]